MVVNRLLLSAPLACLLLLGSTHHAAAQSDEFWYQAAQRYNAKQKATSSRLATQKASQPYQVLGSTINACDLGVNGDFEMQLTIPSKVNNMGGDYGGSNRPDQLSNWYSPTAGSPDYFGTNATATSDVQPSNENSPYGSFTPYITSSSDPIKGAIGLYARQAYTEVNPITGESKERDRTSEYAQVALPNSLMAGAQYYADFQVSLSHATSTSTATNYGIQNGFGLVFTTAANTPAANNSRRDFITLTGPRVLSGPINQSAINYGTTGSSNWQTVAGQFTAAGGEDHLTIGLFNPDASNLTLLPGRNDKLLNTYFFVDAVRIFKIPTAGPAISVSCASSALIGEGCPIPNATYAWKVAGSNTPFATTIQTTVNPTSTTTYTLTVTLPDGSISTSSVRVNVGAGLATPGAIGGYLDPFIGRIRASITAVSGATSYNWYLDGVLVKTGVGTQSAHNNLIDIGIPKDGNCHPEYTVSVEAVGNCGTSPQNSRYYEAGTGSCRTARINTAYPNPATEGITLPEGIQEAILLNDKGRIIGKADASGKLSVQSLPDGLYNLQMQQDGKLINQRIQVKH